MFATTTRFLLVLAASLFITTAATAAIIYDTGVDATGTPLALGSVDPHWSLISSPDGTGPAAYVPSTRPPQWHAGTSTADWISPTADQNSYTNVGLFTYQTHFDLTGFDPSTASLTGLFSSDNKVTDVLINGVSTGITNGDEDFGASAQAFAINSGFVGGDNTIEFIVRNGGFGNFFEEGGPTGLFVDDLDLSALQTTPEPGTIALVASSIVALALYRKRAAQLA